MNERINLPPLMKNAAAQTSLAVMYQEGRHARKSLSKAAKWLKRASEQEYAQAQFMLGNMHMHGSGPVAQSYVAAAELYGKAAAQGNEVASYNLGVLHREGWGVAQNDTAAALHFRAAAELGYAKAQYDLADLYLDGSGVGGRDFGAAVGWLTRAAEEGHLQAQNTLGGLYHGGTLQGSSHGSSSGILIRSRVRHGKLVLCDDGVESDRGR